MNKKIQPFFIFQTLYKEKEMELLIMNITKKGENEILVVSLEGKLDTTTASQLQNVLSKAFEDITQNTENSMTKEVHLDCEKLSYVSSAGLRVLLIMEKMSKSSGIPFILNGISDDIMEVFNMTGFDKMLTIKN